jgi:hypothetical protein
MQLTLEGIAQLSRTSVSHRPVPTALAPAIFFAGVMVETLGIALVAAFAWLLAGGAIATCGLAIAMFADRRWPSPGDGVSNATLARHYLSIRRGL